MNLQKIGITLLCKSLWRGLYGEGTWSRSIKRKYLGNKDFAFWYRKGTIGSIHGSAIWQSFFGIQSFFLQNLSWSFQNGNKMFIDLDPISRVRKDFSIPQRIINFFH